MATLPGLPGDVYFGDTLTPLPDWRTELPEDDSDEDDVSPEHLRAVAAMLGLSPEEIAGAAHRETT